VRASTTLFRATILLASLVSVVSFAQGSSVITGTVTDAATGKPVPDVVVTATSPSMPGEQIAVTDTAGLYRIAQIPAGTYSLRLEKESFKPFTRGDVAVRTDRTVRVNIQMQPEAIKSEEIVVVGKPPTVDVGSTTTGMDVGKEFINNIAFIQPSGSGVRSFESLARVAPQVSGDQYGYGFSGAQSPENLYLVDGISTSDPAYGTNGAQFPIEFVEEANVITGGYMAEYGRATGGVLNVVTKSGSNEFHGSVFTNWTPGALTGTPKEIKNDASVFVNKTDLWNVVDFGAEVGGPIIKDKLWFFVGFSPSFARTHQQQSLRRFLLNSAGDDFLYDEDGYKRSEELQGTTKARFNDTRTFSYIGKLTYLLNSDNSLALSVVGSPTTTEIPFSFVPRRTSLDGSWNGGTYSYTLSNTVSVKYAGAFLDKHLLVDATAGWYHQEFVGLPNDGSKIGDTTGATGTPAVRYRRTVPYSILDFQDLPADAAALCEAAGTRPSNTTDVRGTTQYVMACPATGAGQTYIIGGPGYMEQTGLDRFQGRATVTYLLNALGHHIFKAGLDYEQSRYDVLKAYSGGVFLSETTSGSFFYDLRRFGIVTGADQAQTELTVHSNPITNLTGGFVQDSWSVMDLVTLNAGVRYEGQQLVATDGSVGMSLNNMVSPRLGLIYDFTQQGRSKLFANYARYYEAVPLDIADRALSGENQYTVYHRHTATASRPGCDPLKDIAQANSADYCQNDANTLALGDIYDPSPGVIVTGGGKTPVDAAVEPQSSDEIVLGGEYEIFSDGRAGVSYTKRWMNRVIEDMSVDEAQTYFIGNPGYGLATDFPKATRDYDAVTLYFTKAFSDGWMAQVSYTWSYLRGNYNGLFRPETGQLDPNLNSDFDLKSLMPNRDGILGADRTHYIKAYGSKEFAITGSLSAVLGLSYEGRSGLALNYYAAHPIYGADEAFVLPRGSGGRLPWLHSVNLKAGVSYRLSKDNQVTFTADVFNVLNLQEVTSVDETLSTTDILPLTVAPGTNPQEALCIAGDNPDCKVPTSISYDPSTPITKADFNANFKRPTSYQAPISVRFGLKFTF